MPACRPPARLPACLPVHAQPPACLLSTLRNCPPNIPTLLDILKSLPGPPAYPLAGSPINSPACLPARPTARLPARPTARLPARPPACVRALPQITCHHCSRLCMPCGSFCCPFTTMGPIMAFAGLLGAAGSRSRGQPRRGRPASTRHLTPPCCSRRGLGAGRWESADPHRW